LIEGRCTGGTLQKKKGGDQPGRAGDKREESGARKKTGRGGRKLISLKSLQEREGRGATREIDAAMGREKRRSPGGGEVLTY